MRKATFISANLKSSSAIMFVVVLLLTFWLYTKFNETTEVVLKLKITENEEIILEGDTTTFHDFHSDMNQLISHLETQGINRDNLVVALDPDINLSMGVIADVQQQLRNCDLNKIIYEH